jgi:FtsH-binding integral membrane protein
MANPVDPRLGRGTAYAAGRAVDAEAFDAGLRSYMISVYNTMMSGVLLTGLVALGTYYTGLLQSFYTMDPATGAMRANVLGWIVMLSPLAMVFMLGFRAQKMSTAGVQAMFWGFATVMGLSMSTIFLQFTGGSIATTFFATAAAFGGLSLYGYTTKKDLSGLGTFLVMGVVGLIVAMLLNFFLQSGALALMISIAGVLIFAGLTAYDTQKIKNMYDHVAGTDMMGKTVVMGALTLYLDFINMFMFLLNFLGNRE